MNHRIAESPLEPPAGSAVRRPGVVTFIALLDFLGAGFGLLAGAYLLLTSQLMNGVVPLREMGATFTAVGFLSLVTAAAASVLRPTAPRPRSSTASAKHAVRISTSAFPSNEVLDAPLRLLGVGPSD